jgi:hypothetical protein
LKMRHCFQWEGLIRHLVFPPFSSAKLTSWALPHANHVQPFSARASPGGALEREENSRCVANNLLFAFRKTLTKPIV